MAYDPGALEAALAAVVGETPELIEELRGAFFDSADAHLAHLKAAESPEAWLDTARRMRGLAASFGAVRLIDAARSAEDADPGDPTVLARIERALSALRQTI